MELHSHIICSSLPWTDRALENIKAKSVLQSCRDLLKSNEDVYDMLISHPAFSSHSLREEAAVVREVIEKLDYGYIRQKIPGTWIKNDDERKISFIINYIKERINHLDELCENFIKERGIHE